MKRAVRNLATVVAFLFLLIPALEAADQAKTNTNSLSPRPDSMTVWQARGTIMETPPYIWVANVGGWANRSTRFTRDGFEFDACCNNGTIHYKVDLTTLESNVKGIWYWSVLLENDGGKPLKKVEDKVKTFKVRPKQAPPKDLAGLFVSEAAAAQVLAQLFWLNPGSKISDFICTGDCARVRESFIPAINRLRAFAIDKGSAASEFPQQAAAWRALASKPPLPEEVRAQRLLAENALKDKQLVKAMIHYEAGLKLYPTWPQGWFNAALIAAELGSYAEAVERMQAYLELVPDAPDAQSARDQIVIWRDKAGQ
jgi:hypothetical protein